MGLMTSGYFSWPAVATESRYSTFQGLGASCGLSTNGAAMTKYYVLLFVLRTPYFYTKLPRVVG